MSATRTSALRRLALLAAALAALGACSVDNLAFREDRRLTFTSPPDRETVTLPVTVEWEMSDFDVVEPPEQPTAATPDGPAQATPGQGYFAVFVDQIPQPPGEPLGWFARDDESCERDPHCPDEEYLTTRGIHRTAATKLKIDVLPERSEEHRRDMHEVTVVLLDTDGRRIGESAWRLEFEIDRAQGT